MKPLPEISGYRILEVLAQRETGRLFKARQLSLNRFVVLKVLEEVTDAKQQERFLREARSAARLRHPNVVALHNIGTCPESGLRYLAFEYVQGAVSLQDYLTKWGDKLPAPKALGIALGVAEALVCAEENRIVHRDVRPEKIYIDDQGVAKLADLGLAKRLDLSGNTIAGTTRIGNPFYSAPEIASSEESALDSRADLYGLGVTLFRMLAGELPHAGLSTLDRYRAMESGGLPPVAGVQDAVNDVLARLAAWDPDDRFPSARKAAKELRRLAPKPKVSRGHNAARDFLLETGRILPPVKFTVRIETGGKTLVDKTVGRERVVVGRSSSATVLIDDPRISRRHIELLYREGKVELTPLSTSNSTELNGKLLSKKAYLHPDDELMLSGRFRVHVSWHVPQPPSLPDFDEDDDDKLDQLLDATIQVPGKGKRKGKKGKKPAPAEEEPLEATVPIEIPSPEPPLDGATVPIVIPPPPPSLDQAPVHMATVRLNNRPTATTPPADPPPTASPPDGDATATLASGVFERGDSLGLDSGLFESGEDSASSSIPVGLDSGLFELPDEERPLPAPAWLVFGDGRMVVVDRVVQIGSGPGCEVRLPKAVAPRKAAIVVRCAGSHRLVNVAEDVGLLTLNDGVVPDQAPLMDGDRMTVCGVPISFQTSEE